MKVLDTNLFIRFFTQDNPELAEQAKEIFGNKNLFIPEVVFPEIEYILRIHYRLSKEEIVGLFQLIESKKNFEMSAQTKKAVFLFAQFNLDVADCLVIAHALEKGELMSFDKKMRNVFEELSKN